MIGCLKTPMLCRATPRSTETKPRLYSQPEEDKNDGTRDVDESAMSINNTVVRGFANLWSTIAIKVSLEPGRVVATLSRAHQNASLQQLYILSIGCKWL